MFYFKYNMQATGSRFITIWSSLVPLAVCYQYASQQKYAHWSWQAPCSSCFKKTHPAFYKRYDAFHAMIDINVTFPRSSHSFKKSRNNLYVIFTTCLPLKLLIHIQPSPLRRRKTVTTQCFFFFSPQLSAQTPGQFPLQIIFHKTRHEKTDKQAHLGTGAPSSPPTPYSGACAAEPKPRSIRPAAWDPARRSRRRLPLPLPLTSAAAPAAAPPALRSERRCWRAGGRAPPHAAAPPAARAGLPPARPPREGSPVAAKEGGGNGTAKPGRRGQPLETGSRCCGGGGSGWERD